ncbi:hypothetical protein [Paenarthrobacter aurescens]|uniref:DNA/RNA endonuclease G n=1 Tax=Paenarthrobacter aurescens TaxID=43663 RepID=A0A4Y3NEI4_PAEAU|nr:hypothetical protein [Paenarthrobacter aurescens]MDO6145395.1 hypothetical protein [Paenarthrobacter aurescens]MDO6149200.1 hypothetical protein [Paenarthrobacter aurescens]MDO6160444.1 hypothetical protein [Paenarthrobacter aurescens]MDO6164303.1 hypothetical protein [Paenarthrobacter aurescens]GEB19577.1 hypothetical protein AAU01_23320 [Paenarthrobacter aurescens]
MSKDPLVRRLIRRETHSSRALPSIVAASILLATALWLTLEYVLWLLKDQPLLASPAQTLRWLQDLPGNTVPGGMIGAGAGMALLGILTLGLGLGKGRRHRRSLHSDRAAVVVDDDVIAAAISNTSRLAGGLAAGQVTTTVGGRSVLVRVRPTSGVSLETATIKTALDGELAAYAVDRRLASRIQVLKEGAVGQ